LFQRFQGTYYLPFQGEKIWYRCLLTWLGGQSVFRHVTHVVTTRQTTMWTTPIMEAGKFMYTTIRLSVGWGTALQSGRSRVRFPMVSVDFFIGIILSVALWPCGRLSL
jgi:hypothetical protein